MAVTVRQRIPRYYSVPEDLTVRRVDPVSPGRTESVAEDAANNLTDRIAEATPVKSVTPTRMLGVTEQRIFAHPRPSQPSASTTIIPTPAEYRRVASMAHPAEWVRDDDPDAGPDAGRWVGLLREPYVAPDVSNLLPCGCMAVEGCGGHRKR